jgi:hypothetical protein
VSRAGAAARPPIAVVPLRIGVVPAPTAVVLPPIGVVLPPIVVVPLATSSTAATRSGRPNGGGGASIASG